MARYGGAVCRLCRREGQKLHLKGDRCNSPKCAVTKKAYPPGQRAGGTMRRNKVSTYGMQLRAKQSAKRTYGVLERQFRKYYHMADRSTGITGTVLLQILERRLDNVVYRLGLAASRPAARQMINHGHVLVNGRRVDVASYLLVPSETISLSAKTGESAAVQSALEYVHTVGRREWLEWDTERKQGTFTKIPERAQIPTDVKEQLIVELYSK